MKKESRELAQEKREQRTCTKIWFFSDNIQLFILSGILWMHQKLTRNRRHAFIFTDHFSHLRTLPYSFLTFSSRCLERSKWSYIPMLCIFFSILRVQLNTTFSTVASIAHYILIDTSKCSNMSFTSLVCSHMQKIAPPLLYFQPSEKHSLLGCL